MADQSLLCTEPNNLCLDDVEAKDDQTHQVDCEDLVGNGSEPLVCFVPLQSDEILCLLFEREHQLLPRGDFLQRLRSGDLDLSVRKEALDWIYKVSFFHLFIFLGNFCFCFFNVGDYFSWILLNFYGFCGH